MQSTFSIRAVSSHYFCSFVSLSFIVLFPAKDCSFLPDHQPQNGNTILRCKVPLTPASFYRGSQELSTPGLHGSFTLPSHLSPRWWRCERTFVPFDPARAHGGDRKT